MKYDGIIFDKDGVLLDSGINNFRWMDRVRSETAKKQGHQLSVEDSYNIIHSTSVNEVKQLLDKNNMTWEELAQIEQKVKDKKEELIRYGIIQLFPQVKDILKQIDQPKAVVSNAPREITHYTVEYFQIKKHFQTVKAPTLTQPKRYFEIKKPKPIMIKQVVDELDLENPLMVGDTEADIKAAKNAGIDSVHVNSYNNGIETKPTHQVPRVEKVKQIITN